MSKYTDISGLDELFDIDSNLQAAPTRQAPVTHAPAPVVIDVPRAAPIQSYATAPVQQYSSTSTTVDKLEAQESEVIEEINHMCREIKDIIQVAKYRITTSPDAETMHSAAQLFASAAGLLKELNRGVLESKKMRFNKELELLKISARKDLAEFKAEQDAKKIPDLGTNNTINITQNNTVAFSQEAIVEQLLAKQLMDKQLTGN